MDFSPTALWSHLNDDLAAHYLPHSNPDTLTEYLGRPEGSVSDFAALQLQQSIVKKYIDGSTDSSRATRAVDKFLEVNEACRTYTFDPSSLSFAGQECHELVQRYLADSLEAWDGPRFTWDDIYSQGAFGPGSSYGTDGTSYYEKATGVIGCTKVQLFQQWVADRGQYSLEAKTELVRRFSGGKVRVRDESSLSCVPKNAEIDRTICSEPSLNTFYQLGLGNVMSQLLAKHFDINLEVQQSLNRHLARVGSVTDRYATIDLSSASDSISLTVVHLLFPAWFAGLLVDLRCSRTRLTPVKGQPSVELHMISSMGNGYTFPLQTMIFSAIVRAAYKLCGVPYRGFKARHQTFGVNGDDIIVDRRAYNMVITMLRLYGFTPNSAKTFSTGPFRESCGGDYYYGHYVRGVYAKTLASRQDFVSLVNRLNVWSARWGVPLKNAIGYLFIAGRLRNAPLVPAWDSDTSGLKLPYDAYLRALTSRGKALLRCKNTGSILYTRWAARPKVYHVLEPHEHSRKGTNSLRNWNEAGVIMGSINGTMRNRTFTARSTTVNYESRVAVAPCWELYADTRWRDLSIPAVGQQRWSFAVTENLTEVL